VTDRVECFGARREETEADSFDGCGRLEEAAVVDETTFV